MTTNEQQQCCRNRFTELFGLERARFDEAIREEYARTTGIRGSFPAGVLYPKTTDEVVELVKVANTFRVPIYPISCGKNWGYGDACAPFDGQLIVDLSRMNAICELNIEKAYVVVQPGVTQGQLSAYLSATKAGLWMDATGAGPQASLVGNILDRGFGHTRYGDHFQSCCGMEIVLGDGTILETGFGHFKNAKANLVFKYGIGPVLDGLFSQSNFGIVTRAGIYLMPEPEEFCIFFFRTDCDTDLEKIIVLLASLKLQGVLQSAVHIGNDLRVLSSKIQYPWDRCGGRVPLPSDVRDTLRIEHGIGVWNGVGSITGPKEIVRAIRTRLKKELRTAHPVFINNGRMAQLEKFRTVLQTWGIAGKLQSKISLGEALFQTLKGMPSSGAIPGSWWRVRNIKNPSSLDPLENNAGLIWISPVVAADPAEARSLLSILSTIYSKYGFDTLVTFTLLSERALTCVSNIAFDRSDNEECTRAERCHGELLDTLMENGYIPYRAGPASFHQIAAASSPFWRIASRIKDVLDPNGIISPGRYIPATP
jgi:4-cresol dehydrogenase (hydroxylating)